MGERPGGRNSVREITATLCICNVEVRSLATSHTSLWSVWLIVTTADNVFVLHVASGRRSLLVPICSANGMFAPDMRCGLLRQCASRLRAIRHSKATCLLLRVDRPYTTPRPMTSQPSVLCLRFQNHRDVTILNSLTSHVDMSCNCTVMCPSPTRVLTPQRSIM
jgi:hypothetical protein